jgi:hypothetical protein
MHAFWVAAIVVAGLFALLLVVDLFLFMSGICYEKWLHPSRFSTTQGDPSGPTIAHPIIICTLARNIESENPAKSMDRIETIGACYSDYKVFVFENDSDDDSRSLLRAWARRNPRVELLECPATRDCKFKDAGGYELELRNKQHQRMRQMAKYRNFYLRAVEEAPPQFKHVMVLDFDCKGYVDLDGMRNVMAREAEWDGVACNGLMGLPPFYLSMFAYDTIAFVSKEEPVDVQLKRNLMDRHWAHRKFHWHREKHGLIPVRSAFNGLALYQRSALKGLKYRSVSFDIIGCEHVGLHLDMASKNNRGRFFFAADFEVYMGQQGNADRWSLVLK